MTDSEQEKDKKQAQAQAKADAQQAKQNAAEGRTATTEASQATEPTSQTDAETPAQAAGRGATMSVAGQQGLQGQASSTNEGDDVTVGIGEEIQPIIDRLGELMNDDTTGHPSISKAITRLGEAQQALHEYRAKRGKLPKDAFPQDKPREGDAVL